jgi:tetratricopeptide (TPR) repeat protein
LENEPLTHSAETSAVLDQLERVIRWSEEFTLAFVKCNHVAQCDAMRRALLSRVKDKRVLVVDLDKPIVSVLGELKEYWNYANPPEAVCVFGLEKSINEQREASKIFGALNHERELLRRWIPGALLIWLPDFALDLIARAAPDFWAWRSGVYEFPTRAELWQQDSNAALSGESGNELVSLPIEDKQNEIARLEVLLRTARALPQQDRRSKATIVRLLLKLGVLHQVLGNLPATQKCYEESLALSREIEDRGAEALSLHRLGMIAQIRGELADARRLYEESLGMERRLGNDSNVAGDLHQLGRIAQEQGSLAEAGRFFKESLDISKKLGYESGIARTLHQLGINAQEEGKLGEARRLYQESLEIARKLGNPDGISSTLHQLGRIAQDEGDLGEARRLYEESLSIARKLGDQFGIAIGLSQLGLIADAQRKQAEASELFHEALRIFERLKSPNEQIIRQNIATLESRVAP